jgi:hypothetical protein
MSLKRKPSEAKYPDERPLKFAMSIEIPERPLSPPFAFSRPCEREGEGAETPILPQEDIEEYTGIYGDFVSKLNQLNDGKIEDDCTATGSTARYLWNLETQCRYKEEKITPFTTPNGLSCCNARFSIRGNVLLSISRLLDLYSRAIESMYTLPNATSRNPSYVRLRDQIKEEKLRLLSGVRNLRLLGGALKEIIEQPDATRHLQIYADQILDLIAKMFLLNLNYSISENAKEIFQDALHFLPELANLLTAFNR